MHLVGQLLLAVAHLARTAWEWLTRDSGQIDDGEYWMDRFP